QVSRNSAPVASNSAPEADNSAPSAANGTAAQLAERIEAAALAHFGVVPDLYHVHNPLLGKNEDLLPALAILRDRGARILLQIHDLAEDRRPDVYIAAPYPDGVHYAFLNSR